METNQQSFDEHNQSYDVNRQVAENDQLQGRQAATSDDTSGNRRTAFDSENMGEPVSIGNEDFEEDGGADLGFGETDETEDKDRDNPLRREPGGSTADGSNEGLLPGLKRQFR